MTTTLAEVLAKDRVEFDELESRYQPVLALVEVLIGVVPKCDRYLEIWRPGFRTYNLLVPNFLNLPAGLMGGGAPKDVVGLGMYMSSRAASCAYCSAHTCSFALRRGSSTDAVVGASQSDGEKATTVIAEALSTMPHHYDPSMADDLRRHYSAGDAEWIVMGVAMMGFLNKFMDALGVELEPEAIGDVAELIEPTGWSVGQHGWDQAGSESDEAAHEGSNETVNEGSNHPVDGGGSEDGSTGVLPPKDSVGTMMRIFRNAPGAVKLDKQWTKGVPKDPAKARALVADSYGFDEPLLTTMKHGKPRRALAAMLRHNLDPEQSELGIGAKALAGLVFARHASNEGLAKRSLDLARRHEMSAEAISAADSVPAAIDGPPKIGDGSDLDRRTTAILQLAAAIAPSPAAVDEATVALAAEQLSSAEIVETAVWVSVAQALHRLSLFHQT